MGVSGRTSCSANLQLFPTAFLVYDVDKQSKVSLSYGRRIERPDYRSMTPFRFHQQWTLSVESRRFYRSAYAAGEGEKRLGLSVYGYLVVAEHWRYFPGTAHWYAACRRTKRYSGWTGDHSAWVHPIYSGGTGIMPRAVIRTSTSTWGGNGNPRY